MGDFTSLLLHLVVITPVCQYIFTRFPRPRNILYAVAFLAAVATAGQVQSWLDQPPNYYRILDVDRTAGASDIKRAYREASVRWHPDKSKAPDAPARFQAVSDAYEILSDPESRRLYERFGAQAGAKDARLRAQLQARADTDILFGMAGFYLMWAVLTYLMTLGKTRAQARVWAFVGLIVCAAAEFQMTFAGWDPLANIMTRTILNEKIVLLHGLYPAIMHACILISQFTFVDVDQLQLLMFNQILVQQQELRDLVRHVVMCVDKKNGAAVAAAGGAAALGGINAPGGASGLELTAAAGSSGEEAALSIAQRMKRQETATAKAMAEAKQARQGGGIPNWAIMIGLYVLFNYVLK